MLTRPVMLVYVRRSCASMICAEASWESLVISGTRHDGAVTEEETARQQPQTTSSDDTSCCQVVSITADSAAQRSPHVPWLGYFLMSLYWQPLLAC